VLVAVGGELVMIPLKLKSRDRDSDSEAVDEQIASSLGVDGWSYIVTRLLELAARVERLLSWHVPLRGHSVAGAGRKQSKLLVVFLPP
jgi:hypothetical protein